MFGRICACLYIFGKIGKFNSSSIVGLIIYLLGYFSLIIFVFGRTLFRFKDTAMKIPVHPGSATVEFSSFVSCFSLWLALDQDFYIHMYFQIHCQLYHYRLMNYVSDPLP